MDARSFVEEVQLCVARQNGFQLADMLRLQRGARAADWSPVEQACSTAFRLEEGWRDVILAHCRAMQALSTTDLLRLFGEQTAVVQFVHRISMNAARWVLPVIYVTNEDLWWAAHGTGQEECQQECARIVNKTLTICLTDRNTLGDSRKWGTYRVVALLFRIYFRLGQLNLCANVLRAVGAAELPADVRFPAAHLVTYRYYLGRYYFVNEDYERAEAALAQSFAHCPATAAHNKRLILHYLLPVKLMRAGMVPADALLARHGLNGEFYPAALTALRLGDLGSFTRLLSTHQTALLRLGTFLLWEKLVLLGYRNLLRRIYHVGRDSTRVPVVQLLEALAWMDVATSIDEASAFVANLIDRGLVRGYLSQEKAIIVLSQRDPFPSLAAASIC